MRECGNRIQGFWLKSLTEGLRLIKWRMLQREFSDGTDKLLSITGQRWSKNEDRKQIERNLNNGKRKEPDAELKIDETYGR